MNIIITGATGMVGSEVVRQAIEDKAIEEIILIVRRPVPFSSPKLKTIIHSDFTSYSGLSDVFKNADCCIWCLGISQNQVSEAQYIVITYDYAVAAAKAMLEANPSITFLFVSGEGARSDEKGRLRFGRVKGKTENALLRLPFKKLYIARPAGILPSHDTGEFTFLLKMQYALVGLFRYITPAYVITSAQLAIALLSIAKNGAPKTVISYRELKQIARNAG